MALLLTPVQHGLDDAADGPIVSHQAEEQAKWSAWLGAAVPEQCALREKRLETDAPPHALICPRSLVGGERRNWLCKLA